MAEFLSLHDAVARHVRDGDSVAMEGFTHLIPFAAGHEVIRQGRKHLTLMRMTPDLIYDQLIGMGAVDKLIFSWGGNPGVGSLHRMRDAVENGWPHPLALEEHSHAAMANAYEAGAANLPFAVFRGYKGVDLPKVNPNIRSVTCPYTGEVLATVPAHPSRRRDHPRAPRRPRRQRAPRRHRRRAEGGGARGEAFDRHGRGDRRRPRRALEPNAVILPAWTVTRDRRRARRRLPVLCPRLLQARQRLLQGLGRDRARARHVPRLDEDKRGRQDAGGFRRLRAEGGVTDALYPDRDHDGGRGAGAQERRRLSSSASARRRRRATSPGSRTRRTSR